MAKGSTHIDCGISFALLLALAPDVPLPIVLGCALGAFMLNPDLDLRRSLPTKHWGSIFKWYWYPYNKYIKHRSILSHSPILSTAIRWVWAMPIAYFAGATLEQYALFGVGLAIQDLLHLLFDYAPWLK